MANIVINIFTVFINFYNSDKMHMGSPLNYNLLAVTGHFARSAARTFQRSRFYKKPKIKIS